MNSPRLTALVPVLMAMSLPLGAGEADKTPVAPPLTPEREAFWKEFQTGALSQAQVDAEAKYVSARAAFQDARFVEAHDLVDEAIRIFPSHVGAQKLRQEVLAVLSHRDNRLQMAAEWYHAQQDVKTQEIAVRLAALMESGDKKMAAGDYSARHEQCITRLRTRRDQARPRWRDSLAMADNRAPCCPCPASC